MKTTSILYPLCIAVILISGIFFTGCTTSAVTNPGISGKYVEENNPKSFIEINADGTFYYRDSASSGYTGKWEMKANAIRLHTETLGMTIELEKRGDALFKYSDSGRVLKRFIKE